MAQYKRLDEKKKHRYKQQKLSLAFIDNGCALDIGGTY